MSRRFRSRMGCVEIAEWLEGQTAIDKVADASRELVARGLAV